MRRFLKEPLFHFLLLGAGLFLAYRWMPGGVSESHPRAIVITQGHLEHLVAGFAQTWSREPSEEEFAGLVRDLIREEVYCREAVALGLDKDDIVIRRRLRQKMEFILDDSATISEPSEDDLAAFLQNNPDKFRLAPVISFSHVYLSPDRRAEGIENAAANVLQQLRRESSEPDPSTLGDPFLLGHRFDSVPLDEIATQFGEPFADALAESTLGGWHGPVVSGFGVHLVRVSERTEGRLPSLAEARHAVRREWEHARRSEVNEALYHELLKRYTVTVEALTPPVEPQSAPEAEPS